jgi:uncharacterized membrane protein
MPPANATQHRHLPRFIRVVRARPRLFVSAIIGLIVIAALPADWRPATRLLTGWDVGVILYLAAVCETVSRADIAHIRRRAAIEDEGQFGILALTVAAALASIGAIVALLGTPEPGMARDPLMLLLATLTIVLSWAFIHSIFALHYAHEFYGEKNGDQPGLQFPGDEKPDYWDFIYFSFVIGMTSQVSDVTIASRSIRRTVAAHGVIAFLFNVALLALTVNIAASAI